MAMLVAGLLLTPLLGAKANDDPTDAIKNVIENRLTDANLMQGDNIQVTVTDGTITLDGTVNSIGDKRRAEDIVRRVWDSYVIENNLEVTKAPIPNEQLKTEAQQAIDNSVFYGIYDWVTVDANNGVVTLNGVVTEPWREDNFMDAVARVRGVKEVVDKLVVLPVSIRDDRIRHNAARAIYREMFNEPLISVPNPPVHIIVNNGEVILRGWVNTPLEKMQAKSLVTFYTMASKVVDNLEVKLPS
jgi:osmotically-inducible protein OsmY